MDFGKGGCQDWNAIGDLHFNWQREWSFDFAQAIGSESLRLEEINFMEMKFNWLRKLILVREMGKDLIETFH